MKKFVEKMKRFWSLDAKTNGGFTLVELIVVIAILAILAGIAVPAYSGYVEKAKKAEDEQLLATVNTAFAAACIENGTDVHSLTAADNVEIDLVEGKVDLASVSHYAEDFKDYYAGNEESSFKLVEDIWFNPDLHAFAINEVFYVQLGNGATVSITAQDAQALAESTFGTIIGAEELLGKVDYVTTLAAALLNDAESNSTFAQLIAGPEYGAILADVLGIDLTADGGELEFATTVGAMIENKMDLLIDQGLYPADADRSEGSDLYSAAYNQIVANNAVLYAAQNSNAEGVADEILTILGGSNSKSEILKTVNANSGEGLSQAAMAYGMYTAYAAKNNITVPDSPADVLLQLDADQGFKDYVNNVDGSGQAQKDLEGYLAAMNMINSNVEENSGAVSDILVNGFASDDLVLLLQQAMG